MGIKFLTLTAKPEENFYQIYTLFLLIDILGSDLSLKIITATIITVNKYGNIDSSLVNCRHSKLTDLGKSLKTQIKNKLIKIGKLVAVLGGGSPTRDCTTIT